MVLEVGSSSMFLPGKCSNVELSFWPLALFLGILFPFFFFFLSLFYGCECFTYMYVCESCECQIVSVSQKRALGLLDLEIADGKL